MKLSKPSDDSTMSSRPALFWAYLYCVTMASAALDCASGIRASMSAMRDLQSSTACWAWAVACMASL